MLVKKNTSDRTLNQLSCVKYLIEIPDLNVSFFLVFLLMTFCFALQMHCPISPLFALQFTHIWGEWAVTFLNYFIICGKVQSRTHRSEKGRCANSVTKVERLPKFRFRPNRIIIIWHLQSWILTGSLYSARENQSIRPQRQILNSRNWTVVICSCVREHGDPSPPDHRWRTFTRL
jgi:hypothetical protein